MYNISVESIVIIGNGISGTSAAIEARKVNATAKITIISDELYPCYYRLRLCDLIDNFENHKKLYVYNEEWYEKNRIENVLGIKVTSIDTDKKVIFLNNGENINYTKLVISSGCEAVFPTISGIDKQGVFTFRKIKDVENIFSQTDDNKRNVLIVGGGLLGLEVAYHFVNKGFNVGIVEISPKILPRNLDEEGSLILENKIKSLGISLFLGSKVASINGEKYVEEIVLDNGQAVKTNCLVFCSGVYCDTSFLKNTTLDIKNGVVVDEKMQTNLPDIYACGDVAQLNNVMTGQWLDAKNKGLVAGVNAAGGDIKYSPSVPNYFFNTMGIKLYSIGDIGKNTIAYETYLLDSDNEYEYKKLFFADNILVGAIIMGSFSKTNLISQAIQKKWDKEKVFLDIAY